MILPALALDVKTKLDVVFPGKVKRVQALQAHYIGDASDRFIERWTEVIELDRRTAKDPVHPMVSVFVFVNLVDGVIGKGEELYASINLSYKLIADENINNQAYCSPRFTEQFTRMLKAEGL